MILFLYTETLFSRSKMYFFALLMFGSDIIATTCTYLHMLDCVQLGTYPSLVGSILIFLVSFSLLILVSKTSVLMIATLVIH